MGVVYMGVHFSRDLQEELAWAIDKWLQVISITNVILKSYTIKKLNNKVIFYFKTIVYALPYGTL